MILRVAGEEVMIDEKNYEYLKNIKWEIHVVGTHSKIKYCRASKANMNGIFKRKYMHRLIMNANDKKEIDHINHNGLDNRKINLREVCHRENMMNKSLKHPMIKMYLLKNELHGVRKVSHNSKNKWNAYINAGVNGKRKHIGYFKTRREAMNKRKEYEIKLLKEDER